jgi:hypothetical protein
MGKMGQKLKAYEEKKAEFRSGGMPRKSSGNKIRER